MKNNGIYARWTHPALEMPQEYRRVSYAFFLTDGQEGEIVAARSPDPKRLAIGQSLPGVLNLSPEACRYLWKESPDPRPLFVMTDVGLGLLDKRYDRHAGLGLFLHIHGRPGALARLINHGVLGDPQNAPFLVSEEVRSKGDRVTSRDYHSYEALMQAKEVLLDSPWRCCSPWQRDDGGRALMSAASIDAALIDTADFRDNLEAMAAFVGCDLQIEEGDGSARVRCYRPVLTEAALLCSLTEGATLAHGRRVYARISTLDGRNGGNLALSLRYPVEQAGIQSNLYARVEAMRSRLALHCELCGLDLHGDVRVPARHELREGQLPEVILTLEWMYDPAVLPTSDLKATLKLRRG